MSIGIMIGTHGRAAEQLLKTAQMILGEQDNVSFIEFLPGENADTLADKYRQNLASLDTSKGILFLVDMWGGSPFNAAMQLVEKQQDYDIVTGVNVPMLIEVFMARDDDPSLSELASTAQEAGKTGVKAFRASSEAPAKPSPATAAPAVTTNNQAIPAGGHLVIALARIDDRLIHGQVATRWTKETNIKRIVVVNDEVAQDQVRSTLLKQAAPPGVTAHVVSVDKMVRVYNNPKYANERMMLLFTNPTDVLTLVEQGVGIESVNVGGMAFKQGKTMVSDAVSVDEQDIKAFNELNQRGIEVEFRKVASDSRVNMLDLLKKAAK